MYLHLGEGTVVNHKDIIGIFDLDNTSIKKNTRLTLKKAQEKGQVINVSLELPKSFIITQRDAKTTFYISQISSSTLLRRTLVKATRR